MHNEERAGDDGTAEDIGRNNGRAHASPTFTNASTELWPHKAPTNVIIERLTLPGLYVLTGITEW